MTSTAPLVVEDLGLRRGEMEVLRGVSAAFETAKVTAVVGPSGAGKTSLLRCLNRLEEVTAGRVLLDGSDVRAISPTDLRRRVGMIFQTPVLLERTVRADLAYGLDGVDVSALEAALGAASLDPAFLERRSAALSVGQAQRVCIARALVRHPEVLLMDEPTSALDKDASARIEDLIRSLTARDLAIVLVTHDLGQAQRVADHALLLVDGGVVAAGPPDEVGGAWEEAVR
jgi:putative ABC transport system ATP-binding protein